VAFAGLAWGDSRTEAKLRTANAQIVALVKQVAALTKENAALTKGLAEAKAASKETHAAISEQIKSQAKTHAGEQEAVSQAQAESSQTLSNTDLSVRAETEFEKQLSRVESDVKGLLRLMVILTVLLLAFTGAIVFSTHRARIWQREFYHAKGG
jgi:seryl-tRNA synthetase